MSKNAKPQWLCHTPPDASPAIAKAIRENAVKRIKMRAKPPGLKNAKGRRPPGAKTLFD
ncbi:MAG: hypothetical protein PHV02_00220 [Rhodocyclaceae bacterium]|nr:hypothetical protein [Rhodocyclaceae bacterium]